MNANPLKSASETTKLPKPVFEDYLPIIDAEIAKRRYKWNLESLTWMDYDDVSQIIRIHIHSKWHQYQGDKPIQPWLNAVIHNQIRNVIRNVHGNHSRPCLKCAAARDNDGCDIYGKQCEKCPLYQHWLKRKKPAHDIKMAVSMENHTNELSNIFDDTTDVYKHVETMHTKMKEILKPLEWQVYEGLYVLGEDEDTVARKLGYINNEKDRKPRYKQIRNITKIIIAKARKCVEDGDIDIV